MNTIDDCHWLDIAKVSDPRGNLAFIEQTDIPFDIHRVYYLYDVPSTSHRGGHAHKDLQQIMIALSGSFDVVLDDGKKRRTVTMNKPDRALFIPTMIWREMTNFSSGSVCLVLASAAFDEADYIRDYKQFRSINRS